MDAYISYITLLERCIGDGFNPVAGVRLSLFTIYIDEVFLNLVKEM